MLHIIIKHLRSIVFTILTFTVLFNQTISTFLKDGSDAYLIFFWLISGSIVGLHEMDEVYNDYISNKKVAKLCNILTYIFVTSVFVTLANTMFPV